MKKLEPDPAIFYALHDAGVSSETALRRCGYKVTNPRSVINQKYKLLRRREAALPISAAGDEEETDPCSSEPGTTPFAAKPPESSLIPGTHATANLSNLLLPA